jgi:hypothetical protein
MRFAGLCALLAACSSPPRGNTPRQPVAGTKHVAPREPIDVIAALGETGREVSYIVPGAARLELGGALALAPDGTEPLEVVPLEQRGDDVRVGVRLDHARFAVWTQRARMLAILARDQRVEETPGIGFSAPGAEPVEARLRATALVRRLGHDGHWTRVRYLGALEIDGWVPDDALVDHTPAGKMPIGRIPNGRPTLSVFPGVIIRSEPQWNARELAIMATGYFVDEIKAIDDAWVEVGYEDGDVVVHGFVSRRDPPGRIHHVRSADPPTRVNANATAPSGTCLYTREDGEQVGYLVGDHPVALDATHPGWFALAIDTPWGPITFAARGATEAELEACAPPGSVPAPAPRPPPPPVAP